MSANLRGVSLSHHQALDSPQYEAKHELDIISANLPRQLSNHEQVTKHPADVSSFHNARSRHFSIAHSLGFSDAPSCFIFLFFGTFAFPYSY
uniref:ARAD1D08426p n=1 Tax=Blastobotrys adeninivorans TaxID=409370 RepID=A0A060T866_BLAAD